MFARCASDQPDCASWPRTRRFSTATRQASNSSGCDLARDLEAREQRVDVREVPMAVVVEQARVQPFRHRAVGVDRVVRQLADHLLPRRDAVGLDAQVPAALAQVRQHLLGDADVHGGVDRREGLDVLAVGGFRAVLRRDRRAEHELAVAFEEEVLVERRDLFEERDRVGFEERVVLREQPGVEERLGQPARGRRPPGEAARRCPGRAFDVLRDRRQDAPAAEQRPRVPLVVRDGRLVEVHVRRERFGQVARQRRPVVHLDVLVVVKIRQPGRLIVAVPDALQVRGPAARRELVNSRYRPKLNIFSTSAVDTSPLKLSSSSGSLSRAASVEPRSSVHRP